MVNLINPYNECINRLITWRNRYSGNEYPFKVVCNIFYRQYTMNSIWESQIDSSFEKYFNTEKEWMQPFEVLWSEYSYASRQFPPNILVELMNRHEDVGGLNYS